MSFPEEFSTDDAREEKLPEQQPVPAAETIDYPPKYVKEENAGNIWLRSIASLAAYLILGYYIFPSYKILLLITAIVMIHELGHFIAMKCYRYNELGIFFIPLLGAYVSGTKREVSQKQSAVILLAGPLPGIIIGTIMHFVDQYYPGLSLFDIDIDRVGLLFILLNLINLFPVYPLDGGQLLNRIYLEEESAWSKLFVYLSIGFLCWFAWKSNFPVLYVFPAMMLLRLFGETKITSIEKRIEAEGIHLDLDYDELPDQDYWKIRNILIEEHPSFKDIPPAPPFEFSHKEEKIMTTIQSLLHRHLIQDVSVAGKLLIFLIWAAAISSPWLLEMDMSFFRRFGF
ncbi:MAG TPA: site-2 protease family protein [Chitinophagaceae bacterium]|nr:site-2 protease family protein [Chitinophagaceae bacterium]